MTAGWHGRSVDSQRLRLILWPCTSRGPASVVYQHTRCQRSWRRTGVDVISDADVVKDLHRAYVQQMCARKVSSEITALEQEKVDTGPSQQKSGGQPGRAAAHD